LKLEAEQHVDSIGGQTVGKLEDEQHIDSICGQIVGLTASSFFASEFLSRVWMEQGLSYFCTQGGFCLSCAAQGLL
jgi:hypothetical protein